MRSSVPDFRVTTANKQIHFVQHIATVLGITAGPRWSCLTTSYSRAALGEIIRRRLLTEFDTHTLLRLPTGIFYAQGVKANVLFFDKRSSSSWTSLYREPLGLRPAYQPTLHAEEQFAAPLPLADFVDCYRPGAARSERVETEQFKSFTYDEIVARDKAKLDITWLRDETLDDLDNLPAPEVIAREIVEDLAAALAEFEAVAVALELAALPVTEDSSR